NQAQALQTASDRRVLIKDMSMDDNTSIPEPAAAPMSDAACRRKSDSPTYAMPSEASVPPLVVSLKRPILQIHKPDTVDLASLSGLTKMTGEPAQRLRRLLLKELTDNALDSCD